MTGKVNIMTNQDAVSSNSSNSSASGFAEVNGTRLYYEVAGSGEPLILVHGFTFDRRMWDDQFLEFSKNYKVIRYIDESLNDRRPDSGRCQRERSSMARRSYRVLDRHDDRSERARY
jgi:pimeloyl-ACP methyl ester carboxylesterase